MRGVVSHWEWAHYWPESALGSHTEWNEWAGSPVYTLCTIETTTKKYKKNSSRCKLCLQAAEWTTEMGGSGPLSGLGTLNPTGMKWIPVHIWLAQAWDKLSHWVTRIGRVFCKAWGCSDRNEDEVVKQRNKSEQHFRGYWNLFWSNFSSITSVNNGVFPCTGGKTLTFVWYARLQRFSRVSEIWLFFHSEVFVVSDELWVVFPDKCRKWC